MHWLFIPFLTGILHACTQLPSWRVFSSIFDQSICSFFNALRILAFFFGMLFWNIIRNSRCKMNPLFLDLDVEQLWDNLSQSTLSLKVILQILLPLSLVLGITLDGDLPLCWWLMSLRFCRPSWLDILSCFFNITLISHKFCVGHAALL